MRRWRVGTTHLRADSGDICLAVNRDRRRDPASVPQMSGDTKVLVLIDSLGGGGAERSTIEIAPRLRTLGIETKLVAVGGCRHELPGLG